MTKHTTAFCHNCQQPLSNCIFFNDLLYHAQQDLEWLFARLIASLLQKNHLFSPKAAHALLASVAFIQDHKQPLCQSCVSLSHTQAEKQPISTVMPCKTKHPCNKLPQPRLAAQPVRREAYKSRRKPIKDTPRKAISVERTVTPDADIVCSITLEKPRDPAQVFPCRHIFSKQALNQWIQHAHHNPATCPNCRSHITQVVDLPISTPRPSWIRAPRPATRPVRQAHRQSQNGFFSKATHRCHDQNTSLHLSHTP